MYQVLPGNRLMLSFTRRRLVIALSAASLGWTGDVGPRAKGEEKEAETLSAADVLDKKVLGKATVEFLVDSVQTLDIDSVFKPGTSHAQIIKAKVAGGKADQEFLVIVSKDSATALLKSGIVDVPGYFRGKQMRVSGIIERIDRSLSGTTIYKIHVSRLDQLVNIRRP